MSMQAPARSPRYDRAFDRVTAEYPVQPGAATYTAAGVYDKVGLLVVLTLITGTYSYFADNGGLILVGIFAGLAFSLIGMFKPATAKFMAPLYALAEGLALGGITAYYTSAVGNTGLVPMAIVCTGGIFLAALVIFRSGLVKVTPKFVSMAIMAAFGFMAILLVSLIGLPIPGLSGSGGALLIGVIGVGIGVMFLFVDFNYVQMSEQRQLPAEGEWVGALMLMTSLVLVYINVLSILGRRR